jgi:glucose-1-phosphate thymidylyltransferase
MKGIILAGGEGTRLRPCTLVLGKQLLPVYDKPMIYYPLSTLIHAGVDKVLIISTPKETPRFKDLLGDGSKFGISIEYKIQPTPAGIAQGILLAKDFLNEQSFWFILGDNLFHGPDFGAKLVDAPVTTGARIFAYRVSDPSAYGVAIFDESGETITEIIEKPANHLSGWAIPGLYYFDASAVKRAQEIKPSNRGELEITDVLISYLNDGELHFTKTSRGNAWFDLGTTDSLLAAAFFVQTIQSRQGLIVGSPEEAAYRRGYLKPHQLFLESANSDERRGYAQLLAHSILSYPN